jgi:hypothetical protein
VNCLKSLVVTDKNPETIGLRPLRRVLLAIGAPADSVASKRLVAVILQASMIGAAVPIADGILVPLAPLAIVSLRLARMSIEEVFPRER